MMNQNQMDSIVDQLNNSIDNHLNNAEVRGDAYNTLYISFCKGKFS